MTSDRLQEMIAQCVQHSGQLIRWISFKIKFAQQPTTTKNTRNLIIAFRWRMCSRMFNHIMAFTLVQIRVKIICCSYASECERTSTTRTGAKSEDVLVISHRLSVEIDDQNLENVFACKWSLFLAVNDIQMIHIISHIWTIRPAMFLYSRTHH